MITHEELKMRFNYDPDTGHFTRLVQGNGKWAGQIAGCTMRNGYVKIEINKHPYLAHRLAWFYVHKEWPKTNIDHVNRDPSDNRISNLRLATASQNGCNRKGKAGSRSGVKGVHWQPQARRWRSAIAINGQSKHLGYFDTIDEARAAYADAAFRLHGVFARVE